MFVVVEGIDGCGKSTTISKLMHLTNKHHIASTYAKETTKTGFGRFVRKTILDPSIHLNKSEQTDIFAMARNECLKKIIIPALLKNELVICDRYLLSNLAYQGNFKYYTDDLGLWHVKDLNHVLDINKTIIGYNWTIPTLYFYVYLDPIANVKRLKGRTRKQDIVDEKLTNMDNMLNLKDNYRIAIDHSSAPVYWINGNLSAKQRGGKAFQILRNIIIDNHLKTFKRHW